MFGSSDSSGGVVVRLLCVEQNVVGSNLALCFDFFFTCRKFSKFLRAIPARSQYSMLQQFHFSISTILSTCSQINGSIVLYTYT